MVKVKNNGKLRWCLEKHAAGKVTVKWAANHLKITPRRFKQIYAKYKTNNNTTPTIGQTLDRPKKQVTQETIDLTKQAYKRGKLNAVYLKKIIYAHRLWDNIICATSFLHLCLQDNSNNINV
jgi:hypothetical protein